MTAALFVLFGAIILAVQGFSLFTTSIIGRHLMSQQDQIDALVAQLGKARQEIIGKISDLAIQLDDAGVADKVDLTGLVAAVQAIDNVVPDPEPPAE